jgi:hypothetical protein
VFAIFMGTCTTSAAGKKQSREPRINQASFFLPHFSTFLTRETTPDFFSRTMKTKISGTGIQGLGVVVRIFTASYSVFLLYAFL